MEPTVRDERGRFLTGNQCSPGRKPREVERTYTEATWSACSVEDWAEIVRVAVQDAKAGDSVARKWLADRLLGKPRQEVLVERGDLVDDVHHRVDQAKSGLIELARTLRDRAEKMTAQDCDLRLPNAASAAPGHEPRQQLRIHSNASQTRSKGMALSPAR
jgi:hypothetical protein